LNYNDVKDLKITDKPITINTYGELFEVLNRSALKLLLQSVKKDKETEIVITSEIKLKEDVSIFVFCKFEIVSDKDYKKLENVCGNCKHYLPDQKNCKTDPFENLEPWNRYCHEWEAR